MNFKKYASALFIAPKLLPTGTATAMSILLLVPTAFANTNTIEKGLNLLTEIASVQLQSKEVVEPVCAKVEAYLFSEAKSNPTATVLKILERLTEQKKSVCEFEPIEDSPQDDETETSPTPPPVPQAVWTDEPLCQLSNKNTKRCKYSHKNERGLFIYKQPTSKSFPNYLVCAQSADMSSGIFGSGYAIKSRCEVSAVYWQGYTHLEPTQDMRSDVKGLLNWTNQRTSSKPISMPQLLADQCKIAFSDALYCTPTLLVLPTLNLQQVDVCGLQTEKWAFGIQYISISSASSKWKCNRVNLDVVVSDKVLPVAEEKCVPDFTAKYDASCDLPYIPRMQNNIRVNETLN